MERAIRIHRVQTRYDKSDDLSDLKDTLRRIVAEIEDDADCEVYVFENDNSRFISFQITESDNAANDRRVY